MTLTRHLYELDEVVASLQLCLGTDLRAAIFWTWELVISEEIEIAGSILSGMGSSPASWIDLVCRDTGLTASQKKPYLKAWADWTAMASTRAARVYAIPVEALHSGTTRGDLATTYTNIDELREPLPLLPQGCRWWRRVIAGAGARLDPHTGGLVFPNDAKMEAFMEMHFPTDIPDEWSLADQQKSHGRGYCTSKS